MKTSRAAAAAKAVRALEKKGPKAAGAEFAQVLVAAALPAPMPVVKAVPPPPSPARDHAIGQVALHAKKPLPVPGLSVKAKDEKPGTIALPPSFTPVAPERAPSEAPPAAFVAQLPEDPAMRVTVAPNTAAISIQTADAGDLSLYLRVRQGAAELRVEGAAGPMLERRTDELRLALAAEGLSLKHIEVTPPKEAQGAAAFGSEGDRHRAPPEPFERPDPDAVPTPKPVPVSSTPARSDAGLHVRA